MIGEASELVTDEYTAAALGTGLVAAYSTPSMIALMEIASVAAIKNELNIGQTSVGTEIQVKHLAPTPVGMHVRARSVLLQIDGSHLQFKVEAWDDQEIIGEGIHMRAIIDSERFVHRLKRKKTQIDR
jgi:predicted thioesterase